MAAELSLVGWGDAIGAYVAQSSYGTHVLRDLAECDRRSCNTKLLYTTRGLGKVRCDFVSDR